MKIKIEKFKKRFFISIFFLFSYTSAFAAGETEIEKVLNKLIEYLGSGPAKALALLAIVGVGYSTLHLGKMPKERAVAVVIGIGVIFGGASIMKMLGH